MQKKTKKNLFSIQNIEFNLTTHFAICISIRHQNPYVIFKIILETRVSNSQLIHFNECKLLPIGFCYISMYNAFTHRVLLYRSRCILKARGRMT